jgi:hypothetical protein
MIAIEHISGIAEHVRGVVVQLIDKKSENRGNKHDKRRRRKFSELEEKRRL